MIFLVFILIPIIEITIFITVGSNIGIINTIAIILLTALVILSFYYQSLQQVYQLDDNTLTITKVNKDLADLQEKIANKNLSISVDLFDKQLLRCYSYTKRIKFVI